MEPESSGGLDTFLRRVAQAATIGAAVGTAVAAGRAAARRTGTKADEPQDVETLEQAEPQDLEDEPQAREQEPSTDEDEDFEHRPDPQAQEEEPEEEPVEEAAEEEQQREEPRAEEEEPKPRAEEEEPDEEPAESSHGRFNGEAAGLIGRALRQVQQLTGREAEGVLGLRRDNGNWVVSVEIVELQRVPSSTDVLATYDVVVDENGDLREYNRTGRYIRGRAGEE